MQGLRRWHRFPGPLVPSASLSSVMILEAVLMCGDRAALPQAQEERARTPGPAMLRPEAIPGAEVSRTLAGRAEHVSTPAAPGQAGGEMLWKDIAGQKCPLSPA